jgi:hypothetical protein
MQLEPSSGLSPEESEVERRALDRVRTQLPELAAAYRAMFGNEISTDNAREIVSPEYAESNERRTAFSRASQKPAGALADHLFEEALRNPDPEKRPVVIFTAGGTGAGKTTFLHSLANADEAQFTYDSNLNSYKSSRRRIDDALDVGNDVNVFYVRRDPVRAFTHGVLPRAVEEGRVVPVEAHAAMHRDAAETLRKLVRDYAHDPRVQFSAYDNNNGIQTAKLIPIEEAAKTRYSSSELVPKLNAALDNAYASGQISDAVYRGTAGHAPAGAVEGVPGSPS